MGEVAPCLSECSGFFPGLAAGTIHSLWIPARERERERKLARSELGLWWSEGWRNGECPAVANHDQVRVLDPENAAHPRNCSNCLDLASCRELGTSMGNVAVVPCFLSKAVRVVHPSGKVYIYTQPISIAELLLAYPHHYVCDSQGTSPKGTMLPLEMELQCGRTYALVPLPRLFNKIEKGGKRSQTTSSCFPAGLCLQPGQGFPTFTDSDDEQLAIPRRKGRVTLGSLLALESGCTGLIRRSYKDASRSPTTLQMQRILETAEMHWRYMCQGNKPWRPELESIIEEARKSCSGSPMHELSLIDHHRPLIVRANSVNSSLRPSAESGLR